jgi:hypothetical protein
MAMTTYVSVFRNVTLCILAEFQRDFREKFYFHLERIRQVLYLENGVDYIALDRRNDNCLITVLTCCDGADRAESRHSHMVGKTCSKIT